MAEVWFNGDYVDAAEPALRVSERGFLLGEAAFETMRIVDGALRRWPLHAARLAGGLEFLDLPRPSFDRLAAAAAELASRLDIADGVARLTVGGGPHGGGVARAPGAAPSILITIKPRPRPPASLTLARLEGARRSGLRSNRFKLAGYAEEIAARREAKKQGSDMAILCGSDGRTPACADSANLFWIDAEDRVLTPALSTGALPGTTRGALIEAVRATGLEIEEIARGAVSLDQAAAAFVTNAVMGLVPVSAMDGRALAADHRLIRPLQALEQGAR